MSYRKCAEPSCYVRCRAQFCRLHRPKEKAPRIGPSRMPRLRVSPGHCDRCGDLMHCRNCEPVHCAHDRRLDAIAKGAVRLGPRRALRSDEQPQDAADSRTKEITNGT